MTLSLQALQKDDLEKLLPMARRFYADDGHAWVEEIQMRGLTMICQGDPHGRGYFITLDGQPIGYVVFAFGFSIEVGGYDCFLDEFFIEAPWRGQGLGRQALALLETEVKNLGGRRLCLEAERANSRAQQLYATSGYDQHDRQLLSKWLVR